MSTRPVTVVIADDHPLFRDGLRRLIEADRGVHVIGEAADGLDAERLVREMTPDVLLLDLTMPGTAGIETLKALRGSARTLVLTGCFDPPTLATAIQHGARGVVLKGSPTPLLFEGIHAVMAGHYWVCGGPAPDAEHALRRLRGDLTACEPRQRFSLTPRELEIVAGVTAGESNKEIAERLAVSKYTIKHHLSNVFDKVGVFSRVELAAFAMHHRLVPGERAPLEV